MKIPRSALHISILSMITLFLLFGTIVILGRDFLMPINSFFTYRTGIDPHFEREYWQDAIYKHSLQPKTKITLITIDEKTFNTYQSDKDAKILTLPKTSYARLIDELDTLGARGIAFDIIFQNPDEYESLFAEKIANSRNTVIATGKPTQTFQQMNANSTWWKIDPCLKTWYEKICPITPRAIYKKNRWGHIQTNHIQRLIGYDATQVDAQKWKYAGMKVSPNDTIIYTLPLALVQETELPAVNWLKKHAKKYVLEQYMGPAGSYPRISMADFLWDPEKYKEIIQDSYIFIGESGETLHDLVVSPVNETMMSWVETHAHFLDAIIQNKILKSANQTTMFLFYIVLSVIFVVIYYFVPSTFGPVIALAAAVFAIWFTRYLYDGPRILIDILPLLLSMSLLSYPLSVIYKYFIVDRQKRKIMATFGRYISPKIVWLINSNQITAKLGWEKKEISILFSDIAGFTALSENIETKDLFVIVTSYLSHMTDILLKEWGTLDKYIWDAVMGFFGAPVEQPDHAIRACTTALRMRAELGNINAEIVLRGLPPIDFRVGIATGEVMVGNIGSRKRFSYTVLWDRVNLASRIEAIGKEYKVNIIIAHNTKSQIDSRFFTRELDTIAVQWKQQWVRIFELVNFAENVTNKHIYREYERALQLYRAWDYAKARGIWNAQAHIDPPSQIMAVRCTRILGKKIRIDNAIYRMEHK